MTISLYEEAVKAANAAEKPEDVAKAFLSVTCPPFLKSLDPNNPSSNDRLVKAGRNIQSTLKLTQPENTKAALELLVTECHTLSGILSGQETRKVPTVRYGKTELQMPLVTLGCMRFQQSWNRGGGNAEPITQMSQVDKECQDNLVNILRYAIANGIRHIETAKGYGCSELQMGAGLHQLLVQEKVCQRQDLIIQTKGPVNNDMTCAQYKQQALDQLERLQLDYVDLFSVHGLNSEDNFNVLFDNPDPEKGNLITALQDLQKEGKIRHIGFSTHARTDLIQRAIETDAFAYVNLHHHFVGSYTASGDSCDNSDNNNSSSHGNWDIVKLAHSKDMGVFVISPYDKGGRLYAPSNKLRELTLPEFEPMTYGSLWCWQYHHLLHRDNTKPMLHTIVCGAARPSDLDQPIMASYQMIPSHKRKAVGDDSSPQNNEVLAKTLRVSERLHQRMVDAVPGGKAWLDSWHVGLPNWFHAKYGTQHEKWDEAKSKEENVKQFGAFWEWVPGCGFNKDKDYAADLEKCPKENQKQLKEAIEFVHKWCRPVKEGEEGEKLDVPFDWETAYDMRPWTAFPERN